MNHRGVWSSRLLLAAGLVAAILPVESRAQAPPKGVPAGLTAEAILDKSVAAIGGKAAYAKVRTMVTKASVAVLGQNMNMSGVVETYIKTPGKVYTRQQLSMNIQGKAREFKTETGFDGKQGWTRDLFGKLRDLTAVEAAQAKEQANPDPSTWRQRFTKTEIIGLRKVEGKEAYALRVTPKQGKPLILYYDTTSFLMVRMDMIQESPQGNVPIESYYSDYRTVGGIKTAHSIRQRFASTETTVKMTSVQVNSDVPDTKFAKPKS